MSKIVRKYSSMDVYLIISFMASMTVWFLYYGFGEHKFVNSFFATTFVVGCYALFRSTYGIGDIYKDRSYFSKLFWFQSILLVGVGFSTNTVAPLFLAVIPSALGQYHEIKFTSRQISKDTHYGMHYYALPALMALAFENLYGNGLLFSTEAALVLVFALWSTTTVYAGTHIFDGKSFTVLGAIRHSNKSEFKIEKTKGERLFFHDIINQTHGINLFLNSRINRGLGVSADECKELVNEIKVIQSQIQGHYKFKHKNLVNNYDYVSFEFLKQWVERVTNSFLPNDMVNQYFDYHEDYNLHEDLIYFPSFSRIFTNIIKNISEVRAYKVRFHFHHSAEGLSFQIENYLFDSVKKHECHEIKDKILGVRNSHVVKEESGHGLESISLLCRQLGGHFDFYFEDHKWVNKVFIPYKNISQKKAA